MTNQLAEKAIHQLFELYPQGVDLSLKRIAALLQRLGNPQQKLPPVFHITGTNGKGSTSTFCRYLLEQAGYRVHVHTSPHLVRWHERYRLGQKGGGQLVDDKLLADTIQNVVRVNNGNKITVFEILTAVAFVLFASHPADAVIMEVGLGGRFDATNVITKPAVSIITPISLDHQSFLGDTIEKIAFEKAGIIKQNCPVVIGFQQSDKARDVLIEQAQKCHSPTTIFAQDFFSYSENGRMVFQDNSELLDLPMPHLSGEHQLTNAAAAIAAVKQAGFHLDKQSIADAMTNTHWPARLQQLTTGKVYQQAPKNSEIWLDGGHNPAAAQAIAATMCQYNNRFRKPFFMITGMLNTKDSLGYFAHFRHLIEAVYTVPLLSTQAGISPQNLAENAAQLGLNAYPAASLEDALNQITQRLTFSNMPPPRILIGGSLYLAGDVLKNNATPPT